MSAFFVIDSSPDIKISFLEFKENAKDAFTCLNDYTKNLIELYNKNRAIIGINGQISYGLGILTNDYNRKFEFNSNYNREYYTRELDQFFPVVKKAFSYQYHLVHSIDTLNKKVLASAYTSYTFRYFDPKHFKKDLLIVGKICHEALKDTPYYSIKTPQEMYELMKPLLFIMKKEDIIFALKDGKEIGFMYSHPDYAEFFDKPKFRYIPFFIRTLLKKTNHAICNVLCVLPEHQSTGVALALIDKIARLRKDEYPLSYSSFVLEDNIPSTTLCRSLSIGINKEFHLYEILGNNNV